MGLADVNCIYFYMSDAEFVLKKLCVMVLCLWHIQCYAYMCNYKCAFANSICMYMAVNECLFGVFYLELMTDDNVDSQGESKRNWFIAKK